MSSARQRVAEPLAVADLAAQAHVSVTTLHRRFKAVLGTTPLTWLTAERVDLARRLIEQDTGGFESVARRSGLGSAANLRTHLRRHTGLGPAQYRDRFVAR